MIESFALILYTPNGDKIQEEEFLTSPEDEYIKDRLRLYGEDCYVVIEKRVRLLPFA